jgi:hypothetical protein
MSGTFSFGISRRAPVALAAFVNLSEAFAVPECDCYPKQNVSKRSYSRLLSLSPIRKLWQGLARYWRNCLYLTLVSQVKIGSANFDMVEYVVSWADCGAPAAGQAALLTPSDGEK